MPRIPIRVEPYSNPQRRQRHFKNKRDQILRALGKASYINGSQFAILFVNSKGEAEQYASEVFQSRLPVWFSPEVLGDAQQLVLSQPLPTEPPACSAQSMDADDGTGSGSLDEELEDDNLSDPTMSWEHDEATSRTHAILAGARQSFGAVPDRERPLEADVDTLHMSSQSVGAPRTASQQTDLSLLERRQQRSLLQASATGSDDRIAAPTVDATANGDYRPIVIGKREEVGTFFETRFRQLQQLVCKIVAKAWIKVIEPKKQTRFPYNRGEDSKPSWWPDDVRHKEPDHLMKPERISLLMIMLRSGKVPINRLELATAEVAAFIPPDKIHLLREIYRVAREEERLNQGEIAPDTKVYVAASAATISGGYGVSGQEGSVQQRSSPLAADHGPFLGSMSHPGHRPLQPLYMPSQSAGESYGSRVDFGHRTSEVQSAPPLLDLRMSQQQIRSQTSYTAQFPMPISAGLQEASYDDASTHVPYTPSMPPPHSAHIGPGDFYNATTSPVASLVASEGYPSYGDLAQQASPHLPAGPSARRHSYAQPVAQDRSQHAMFGSQAQRGVYPGSAMHGLGSSGAGGHAGMLGGSAVGMPGSREIINNRLSSTTSPMSSTTSSGMAATTVSSFGPTHAYVPQSQSGPGVSMIGSQNVLGVSGLPVLSAGHQQHQHQRIAHQHHHSQPQHDGRLANDGNFGAHVQADPMRSIASTDIYN